jgi:D-alanyl-D-alanine carboxypeptidase (penicillin-binding protein 5/6)
VVAARPVEDGPGWPETGLVAGAAGLGAGAVVLLLRLAGSRIERE